MTKQKEIAEIHGMNVEDAGKHLADLTTDDLRGLRALETAEGDVKSRVTMLAAIDAALEAKGEPFTPPEAGAGDSGQTNDPAADANASLADMQAKHDEVRQQLTEERADHEATMGRLATANERIEAMQKTIDDLTAAQDGAAAALASGAPAKRNVAVTAALTGATRIAFADAGGKPIKAIAPVDANPRDFHAQGGRAIYDRRLFFAAESAKADVAEVVLLDGGEKVGGCPVHPVLNVGGGRAVDLPAGHLAFTDA